MHTARGSLARFLAISFLGFLSISCSGWVNAGYTALSTTADAARATEASFVQFDAEYQHQVVVSGKKASKTGDQIQADLDAYRAKRATVVKAFADLKAIMLVGQGLLPLAEKGTADKQDVATWIGDLFKAANVLSKALQQIGAAPVIAAQLGTTSDGGAQ
jgi:hypothetical protein